jgi:D-alanine-D-alanine ligase
VRNLRVAVIMGGTSAERDISLSTGRQILAALDPAKYDTMALDAAMLGGAPASEPARVGPQDAPTEEAAGELVPFAPMDLAALAGRRAEGRPDVVFIALHGRGGEDGTIQGMLELLGIPYTGSGVLASALAMDKTMTKRLLGAEGIPVPEEVVLRCGSRSGDDDLAQRVAVSPGYPVIVKPNAEGSTIGCTIVRDAADLAPAVREAFRHDATVLVEQFLTGIEITAGLLGNEDPEVLPLIEIVAHGGVYDYHAKYAPGASTHIIPARISDTAADRAREYACRCHQALGCRGMSRVDMIVVGDDPYVLEVNTIPGMTPTSLLPDAARAAGIPFAELLDRLIALALRRDSP